MTSLPFTANANQGEQSIEEIKTISVNHPVQILDQNFQSPVSSKRQVESVTSVKRGKAVMLEDDDDEEEPQAKEQKRSYQTNSST